MNRSESASMTSMDLSLWETRMAKHSWVNSSMMLSDPEFDPQIWDDDIGEAVACVLSACPDAGDEEVIRLYGECEHDTNVLLGNPHVGEAVGRFFARIVTIGELSGEDALRECIRNVVPGAARLTSETVGGVPAGYLH